LKKIEYRSGLMILFSSYFYWYWVPALCFPDDSPKLYTLTPWSRWRSGFSKVDQLSGLPGLTIPAIKQHTQ